MATTSKRRYLPIGTQPIYDRFFDKNRIESRICNSAANKADLGWIPFDKNNILRLLKMKEGDERGRYTTNSGEIVQSELVALKFKIRDIDKKFKNFQQQTINEGREKPEKWPLELWEKKMKLEARYDVTLEEVQLLQNRLDEIVGQENSERARRVLRLQPRGTIQLRNGHPYQIDGQFCGIIDGVPVIDDVISPFDGYATADYLQHISKPWRLACLKLQDEYRKKVEAGEMRGPDVPVNIKAPIPEMPKNVVNYKQRAAAKKAEKEQDSDGGLTAIARKKKKLK